MSVLSTTWSRYVIKHLLTAIILALSGDSCKGQLIPAETKDSLNKLICEMVRLDQRFRSSSVIDSVEKGRQANDTAFVARWTGAIEDIDSNNFRQIEAITRAYGFPGLHTLGQMPCRITGILIHWSKKHPEWFNSPENIKMFKAEIKKGNLSKVEIDQAHFFYVAYTDHGLEHFEAVNKARMAYGLKPYKKAEFLKKRWIEPMKE